MAITSIVRIPVVGAVGKPTRFKAVGTPVGNELRYYLTSKPSGSSLVCLDDVDTTDPDARAKARLRDETGGFAAVTLDAPGHYLVQCHDVTITRTPQKYPDAPKVADTDNDFAGAPVITLADGDQAVSGLGPPFYSANASLAAAAEYLVSRSISRDVGVAPNTGKITLLVNDVVEIRDPSCVQLVPSPTPLAAQLAGQGNVRGQLDAIRAGYEEPLFDYEFNQDVICQAARTWNLHLPAGTTGSVHTASDAARAISVGLLSTLSDVKTLLATLESTYAAHRLDGTKHVSPDNTSIFPDLAKPATDLQSTHHRLWWAWRVIVNGDFTILEFGGSPRFGGMESHFARYGDGASWAYRDFPMTLGGCIDSVTALVQAFNAHLSRTTHAAPHHAADTDNALNTTVIDAAATSPDVAVKLVNALADAYDHHVADEARDPTTGGWAPAATPYHGGGARRKAPFRASAYDQAVQLGEIMQHLMALHFLDVGAHSNATAAVNARSMTAAAISRLQGYWYDGRQGPIDPRLRLNNTEAVLTRLGWK